MSLRRSPASERGKSETTRKKSAPSESPGDGRQVAPGPDGASGQREQEAYAVSVENLDAYYGAMQTLKRVSIEFAANQVTALIGPSGSGKSTVVRCINRMHEEIPGARVEGSIKLDGLDIYDPAVDVTAVRRTVGMVFQKPNPFPTMSIFDNVAAGVRLSGGSTHGLDALVQRSLEGVGLWSEVKDRLDAPGIGLSGGQQQRLYIARAIAVEPHVILMDEPASALDPGSTLKIEELMEGLKRRYTIIIVTHNMQQAGRIADTTAFLDERPGS